MLKKITCDTSLTVPRQRRPSQSGLGANTVTNAKLWGRFVVFFLRGQNRNIKKVRELKLLLKFFYVTEFDFSSLENSHILVLYTSTTSLDNINGDDLIDDCDTRFISRTLAMVLVSFSLTKVSDFILI